MRNKVLSLTFSQSKFKNIFNIIALIMCVFQIWVVITARLEPLKLRATHIGFVLILIFLSFPATKALKKEKKLGVFDLILAIIPIVTTAYIYVDYERLSNRIDLVSKLTMLDYILFGLVVFMVFEATRRTVGWSLTVIALLFTGYAFLGKYLHEPFWHRGITWAKYLDQMAMNINGIYGTPVGVSSTYVFIFVLFGAFLIQTGAGQCIIDVANAMAGKSKGGPAKIAVVSSMLFGTINGSSVANVITTGTFTIPMMKSLGYKKDFAGAVEAVASTGGQIMPPIMGAAAFIMAEIMGVQYLSICKAAILPAILYYSALLLMVHLEADKLNLPTMPNNNFKKAGKIFMKSIPLFLPIAALIYTLFLGYSPTRAGLIALGLLVIIGMIQKENRLTPKKIVESLISGAKSALVVSITCATAGIVTGIVNALGIGFKFTSLVFTLSHGNLFAALVLVMLTTLILGTGLPTTAAYIIAAAVTIPPLMDLGVGKMAANFFALYFACISSITPPVAVAAYAGAALSGGSPMKTGTIASKLGISGFLVPFMFVYQPILLLEGNISEILIAIPTALVGIFAVSCALEGWILTKINAITRILMFAGGLMLMIPGIYTDLGGLIIICPFIYLSYRNFKKNSREMLTISREEFEAKVAAETVDKNTEMLEKIDLDVES